MAEIGIERRRMKRVKPAAEQTVSLEVSLPVEVLDISPGGVQVASRAELRVGDRAELRATIGSRSVAIMIEIQRVGTDPKPPRDGLRYRAGAVFSNISMEQQLLLGQILGTEPLS